MGHVCSRGDAQSAGTDEEGNVDDDEDPEVFEWLCGMREGVMWHRLMSLSRDAHVLELGCGISALAESLASQRVGGQLIELCLGENKIGGAGCEAITALFNVDEQERPIAFPELQTLVLERNPLPPEALRGLRRAVRNVESFSCSCGRRVFLEL